MVADCSNTQMKQADIRRLVLAHFVERDGLSSFAKRVGKPDSQINDMLAGRKSFGEKVARDIESKYDPSKPPGWLDSLYTLDSLGGVLEENVSPGPDVRGQLPLISWVKAGEFCDVIDNFQPGDAEAWYPCPVSHSPNAYILRVNGDSMSPEYRDGELIFIDQRGNYEHGDDVIVRSPEHKATFKRLQITHEGTFLLAINPAWPDRIIKIPDDSQICGKVIFQGRPR